MCTPIQLLVPGGPRTSVSSRKAPMCCWPTHLGAASKSELESLFLVRRRHGPVELVDCRATPRVGLFGRCCNVPNSVA
jgi:hypothetical protein